MSSSQKRERAEFGWNLIEGVMLLGKIPRVSEGRGWAGDGKGPPGQEPPEASVWADRPVLWEEAGGRLAWDPNTP